MCRVDPYEEDLSNPNAAPLAKPWKILYVSVTTQGMEIPPLWPAQPSSGPLEEGCLEDNPFLFPCAFHVMMLNIPNFY